MLCEKKGCLQPNHYGNQHFALKRKENIFKKNFFQSTNNNYKDYPYLCTTKDINPSK